MLNLVPYHTRIFVKEDELPERTVGGIIIPESTKEKVVTTGTVMAVGDEIDFCKVGDTVFYARYSGAKCSWEETEYRVMNEEDLLGRKADEES